MRLPDNDYQILKLTDDFYKKYPDMDVEDKNNLFAVLEQVIDLDEE